MRDGLASRQPIERSKFSYPKCRKRFSGGDPLACHRECSSNQVFNSDESAVWCAGRNPNEPMVKRTSIGARWVHIALPCIAMTAGLYASVSKYLHKIARSEHDVAKFRFVPAYVRPFDKAIDRKWRRRTAVAAARIRLSQTGVVS
jgi:hypothetical protein